MPYCEPMIHVTPFKLDFLFFIYHTTFFPTLLPASNLFPLPISRYFPGATPIHILAFSFLLLAFIVKDRKQEVNKKIMTA